jgi:hypothetical protein
MINFDRLSAYMGEIEKGHDALTEFVIRGECIVNGPLYPQGGSGVLFSRHAVERLIPLSRYSIWGFWEDCPDKRLGRLTAVLGIDGGECASSAFLGSLLDLRTIARIDARDFAALSPCPRERTRVGRCKSLVSPVNRYVFFHLGNVEGYNNLSQRMEFARKLWGASGRVEMREAGGYKKGLCLMTTVKPPLWAIP